MKRFILAVLAAVALTACDQDAQVASRNISQASDMFEISRRVVFFNGITDKYLLSVEGRCSIDLSRSQVLAVTCKISPNDYRKHYLGLSDNVSYFVEQMSPADVSVYHYRVIFKPQTIVPDIDFRGNARELGKAVTPD
jgi:hypothetical protein